MEEKKDIKKAERVIKEKDAYEKATQSWRTEAQEIWKAINGELSENVYPWENPQFIPKIRTEVSFVTPFIFSGEPEMEVTMVGDEDKEASFLLDQILTYRVEKVPRVYDAALAWVTQGVALGTSLLKVSWKFEQRSNGIPIDRPEFAVPNILDIYTNPMISDVDKQVSIIEKISMTVSDVKKSELFNENKKKVLPCKKKDTTYGSETMADVDIDNRETLENEFEMVDIYERWSADEITTVADSAEGPLLLRCEPNPYGYIPYVKFGFEKEIIPNRFYCKGVGQNTIGLQEMFYDLFNMTMLNLKILVNQMWRVDPGSRINPNDLIGRPGGTVRAAKDEAEPIQVPDLKRSAFEMLALISEEHKRASGATELIQGSPGSRTLGQDQLAQSNVSNRFELVRRGLKSSLSRTGWIVLDMELKNLQSIDSEIMKIFPSDMRENVFALLSELRTTKEWDVVIRGDTILSSNKDILSKQMLDMYNLIGQDLLPQEKRNFVREIARMRGMTSVNELIPDAPIPTMDPNMMAPNMMDKMQQGGPIDGNALPEIGGQISNEGINEATYGFETPNSRR